MAELRCSDGTIVQISGGTEVELRKAFESKHVWKHGDVFKNLVGVQIYLEPSPKPIVVNLGYTNSGGTPEIQLDNTDGDVEFLFNIKDRL